MGVRNFIKNVKGSPLWKRTTAGALVLLMLVTLIPAGLSLARADEVDANDNTKLINFITGATIAGPDIEVEGNTWRNLKQGVTYALTLDFLERSGEGGLQFLDDGTMTYTLPAGLVGIATDKKIPITVAVAGGQSYTVNDNPFTVSEDGKTITFQFNKSDPYYTDLISTSNTSIYLNFDVQFDGTVKEGNLDFGRNVIKTIDVSDSHHASVTKDGWYSAADNKMHYYVNVTSDGISKNISLADTVGSALAIDMDSITISGAEWSTAPQPNGDGFTAVIKELGHNGVARIEYTATVKPGAADDNGRITADQASNTVTITPPSDDAGPSEDFTSTKQSEINQITISKTGSAGAVADNKSTVTWTVTVNPDCNAVLKHPISDTIDNNQVLSGTGITVTKYYKDGTSESSVTIPWDQLNVADVNAAGSTWSYDAPQNDTVAAKYVITYTTEVNTSDFVEDTTVTNTAVYHDLTAPQTATIEIDQANKYSVGKEVGDVHIDPANDYTNSYIEWKIKVSVPEKGFTTLSITDTLPVNPSDSNDLEGLVEGSITAAMSKVSDSSTLEVPEYTSDVSADGKSVVITFTHGVPSVTGGTGARELVITLRTKVSKTWLLQGQSVSWLAGHTNNATVVADNKTKTTSATAYPSITTVNKKGEVYNYTIKDDTVGLPVYRYEVIINPVSGRNITITDILPKELRLLTTNDLVNSWDIQDVNHIYGGDQYYQGSGDVTMGFATADNGDGRTKVTFTTDAAPLNSGTNYGYYRLVYYAVVKDADALKSLTEKAYAKADKTYILENEAEYNGVTATSKINYKIEDKDIIQKNLTNYDELSARNHLATYEVVINPMGIEMNGGEAMTLTDEFSSTMSLDYSSVEFISDPAANAVEVFDVNGNILTATIPDSTKVTMLCTFKVLGNNTVDFWNNASINGYLAAKEYTKDFSLGSDGGGTSSIPVIRIFKHETGNMMIPLKGAKFELYRYDNDGNPVLVNDRSGNPVTVTTDAEGMATIQGNQNINGWTLEFDRKFAIKEVEAPVIDHGDGTHTYYELDDTLYQFTIPSDDVADYSVGVWKYHNDDIMRIKNRPTVVQTGQLTVTKTLADAPDSLDLSTITLKVTVAGSDSETYEYTHDLQYVAEHVGSPTETEEFEYDAATKKYTWTLKKVPYGTATVEENITGTVNGYDLVKTYTLNGSATVNAYPSGDNDTSGAVLPEVTIGATEQTVNLTNTYVQKNDGTIRIHKYYIYKNDVGKVFKYGLFTDAAGTIRYGNKTVTVDCSTKDATYHWYINDKWNTTNEAFTELPYGTYYVYELDDDGNPIRDGSNMEFTVNSGQGQKVIVSADNNNTKNPIIYFTNTEKTGSIQVTKKVVTDGTNTMNKDDYEDKISLKITNSEGTVIGEKTLQAIARSVSDDENVYTVSSNANGDMIYTWQINEVPFGTYTVEESYEDEIGDYYKISSKSYSVNGGEDTEQALTDTSGIDITVTKDGNPTFVYTNTYTEKEGSLKLTKRIIGDTPTERTHFVYRITMKDRDGNDLMGKHTFGTVELDFGTTGIAEIQVTGGESRTISHIPAGYTYTVTEKVADGTNYKVDENGKIDKHYVYETNVNGTGTIPIESSIEAVITNRYSNLAKLSVKKSVTRGSDGNYAIPTADEFDIYLHLTNAGGAAVSGVYPITYIKGTGTDAERTTETITFVNGEATIKLCHTWEAVISDLEVGYKCTVKEKKYTYTSGILPGDTANEYGYQNHNITDGDTEEAYNVGVTEVFRNNVTSGVTVNNYYKEKPTALTVEKKVEYDPKWISTDKPAIPEDIYFEIEIDFSSNETEKLPASGNHGSVNLDANYKGTFILQNGQTAAITGIPAECKYTITEKRVGRMVDGVIRWSASEISGYDATGATGSVSGGFVTGDYGDNKAAGDYIWIQDTNYPTGHYSVTGTTCPANQVTADIVRIDNYYTPSVIYINKLNDANPAASLEGAELAIIDVETNTYATDYKGEVLKWTSGTSAKPIIGLTADGVHKYMLREIKAPDGYLKFNDVTFTISEDNQIVVDAPALPSYVALDTTNSVTNNTLKVTDSRTKLKIQKLANYKDGLENQPLEGASLSIKDSAGVNVISIGNSPLTWNSATTAQDITGLPFGTYQLVENSEPDGYYKADPITFTLRNDNKIIVNGQVLNADADGVCTLSMVDKKKIKIYVSKVDATSEAEVAGAHIQILDVSSERINASGVKEYDVVNFNGSNLEWDSAVDSFQTNMEIGEGSYILRETVAPTGYTITTDTRFNIKADGTIDFTGISASERTSTTVKDAGTANERTVLLVNDSMTQVKFNKTDLNGVARSGAWLGLREVRKDASHNDVVDAAGNYVSDEVYLDGDGNVVDNNLLPNQYYWVSDAAAPKTINGLKTNTKYILREYRAPDGYTTAADSYFTLNEYGVLYAADATSNNPGHTSSKIVNNIIIVEDKTTELSFTKYGKYNETRSSDANRNPDAVRILPGVTFRATQILDEDGHSPANPCIMDATSNTIGTVYFEGLTKGTYTIQETSSTGLYKLDNTVYYAVVDDNVFQGLTTIQGGTAYQNSVTNDQYRANIKLVKVSENDHSRKLGGAKYGLFFKDTEHGDTLVPIATDYTDTNGEITFEGVLLNREYVIKELEAIDGYYISKNPISVTFTKDAGGNVIYDTLAFEDGNGTVTADMDGNTLTLTWLEPVVNIRVAKVDGNYQPLSGAKLQIQDMNGNVIIPTFTTANTEKELVGELHAGKTYQLVEVQAPNNYQQAAPVVFTVPDTAMEPNDPDGVVTVTMVDYKYPEIYVSKVDATTEDEVAGAHIQILDEEGEVVVFENNRLEWDSEVNGYTTKVKIAPGTYTLRETVAPDGYAVTTDTKFIVKENGSIDYTGIPTADRTTTKTIDGHPVLLVKDNMTKVSINKVDVTGDQPLAGAHLRILDENGNPVHIDENGYVVDAGGYTEWISSGDQPKQIYGLKTETVYTLEETVAPSGYTITTKTTFVLDQYGRPDTTRSTVSFNDENVILVRDNATSLNFEKYGTYNESCIAPPESPDAIKPIAGVGFTVKQILDEDGNAVTDAEPVTGESNENGVVIFTKLPKGTYEVQETSALSRYIPDDTIYYAKLTDGAFAGLTYDKEGTKPVENNRLINQVYRTDISFTKVSEINQAKKLANSTYGLFTKKNGTLNRISTAVTDENGVITFKGVLINTEYVVQELVSPDGYYVSKDPITLGFKLEDGKIVFDKSLFDSGNGTVMISADGSLTWLEPEVVVNFLKKDEDGNPLPGAKLQVVDSNGTIVVEPWISTSTAYQVTAKFKVGETYRLMELAAPDGYEVADPVAFTIDDSTVANGENKIITITMTDKKETKKTDEKKAPKTGDSTPIQLAVLLAMVSLFVGLIMLDRKLFGRR